jgi:hypothetical protein
MPPGKIRATAHPHPRLTCVCRHRTNVVEFGKANFLDKACQQPDKVRMVLSKVKTDGLMPTLEVVRSKLDQPLPMGYCNAGVVMDVCA